MRTIVLVAGTVMVLVALFFVLQPGDDEAAPSPPDHATHGGSPTASQTSPQRPLEFEFQVRDGTVEGPHEVRVEAGALVHLNVTSDVPGIAHVHGFEVVGELKPGAAETVMVKADAPGRYDVEFHADDGETVRLAELIVTP